MKILGYGYAHPENVMTNDDLSKLVDTSDEWITSRTGIKQRYISTNENTSDLGYRAALNALKSANIDKDEISLIVVATMSPDNYTPSTACMIQEKLQINNSEITAFDINVACSGFVYALNIATKLLKNDQKALVIGAEVLSKLIDWNDRSTCILFGDGAGALVVEKNNCLDDWKFYTKTLGDPNKVLIAQGRNLKDEISKQHYLMMNGSEVYRFAINALSDGIEKVLKHANKEMSEIDLIIPHQANIRIIQSVAKRLNIDEKQIFINLEQFGNTSAASIAIALAQCYEQKKLHDNMKILLVGFGAGLAYGAAYLEL